jgi:transposase
MARPYSLDLRERVIGQVASGMSCHEAAELNGLVPSTVVKWMQRVRQTGSAAAKPMGGKRPYLLEEHRAWLLTRLREKPDLTLHALLGELAERRAVVVSCDTLWRFLKRAGVSFKKRRSTPANRIAPMSPAGVDGGAASSRACRSSVWSSSTRPGPRRT